MDTGWIAQHIFKNFESRRIAFRAFKYDNLLEREFLKLVEEGGINPKLPKIAPYSDHLEYLKDQFACIELLHSLSPHKKTITHRHF